MAGIHLDARKLIAAARGGRDGRAKRPKTLRALLRSPAI